MGISPAKDISLAADGLIEDLGLSAHDYNSPATLGNVADKSFERAAQRECEFTLHSLIRLRLPLSG